MPHILLTPQTFGSRLNTTQIDGIERCDDQRRRRDTSRDAVSRSSFARNRRGDAAGTSELHLLNGQRDDEHCNQLKPFARDSRSPMPKHPGVASDVGACNLRNVPGTAVPKMFGRLLTKFRRFICGVCRPICLATADLVACKSRQSSQPHSPQKTSYTTYFNLLRSVRKPVQQENCRV